MMGEEVANLRTLCRKCLYRKSRRLLKNMTTGFHSVEARLPHLTEHQMKLKPALLLTLAAMASVPFAGAATLITSAGITGSNNQLLPNYDNALGYATYGSNVSASAANWTATAGLTGVVGTPNIALRWDGEGGGNAGGGFEGYPNWNGRTGRIQLDSGTASTTGPATGPATPDFYISFIPSSGSAVLIDSFILDAWNGGGNHTVNWFVTNSAGTTNFDQGTWTKDNAGGWDTIDVDYTGGLGETLVLKITVASTHSSGSYLAMGGLSFDQVPEPASAMLALLGAIPFLRRRR